MIINQPYDQQLGLQLIEAIQSGLYSQLTIMVAYAKLSGVYRLSPYIEEFCKNGGNVRCIVGIDQQNTTYDALFQLLKLSDDVNIFHSESVSQTFHIKCYWLSNDAKCWYAIGSNNLTAGGLFSNYELSNIAQLNGNDACEKNSSLQRIYTTYSNPASACCHKLSKSFLDELLSNGYVTKELQQRKAFAEAIKQGAAHKNKLFGNESFSAPTLSKQYSNDDLDPTNSSNRQKVLRNTPNVECANDNSYLIRLIPRAGNRSKQVHFTVDLLEKYFCLTQGDSIMVQEMNPLGKVGEIEHRTIVFSQRNRNVKIELAGASILDTQYPVNPETRPVLIIKRVNTNLFVYMILLDGNEGYASINNHLKTISTGKSLPYEVIDENTMFSLWHDCPIV